MISRFARLYPAFWTALLLAAILVPINGGPIASAATMLANATMLPVLFGAPLVDGVYWTLVYEIVFYLFAACFFLTGSRKSEFACLGWLLAAVLAMAWAPYVVMKAIAAPNAHLFAAGVMIYRLRQNSRNFAGWAVLDNDVLVGLAEVPARRAHQRLA